MHTGKIDVTKIDKTFLFKGKAGTYLDIALIPNKSGRDQYGNDGKHDKRERRVRSWVTMLT